MIDEQSPASGHDYALDRSAIGAGYYQIMRDYFMYEVICIQYYAGMVWRVGFIGDCFGV